MGDMSAEHMGSEDALARIEGVAQVLEHFAMKGGIDVAIRNSQMFAMLAAALIEAIDTIRDSKG